MSFSSTCGCFWRTSSSLSRAQQDSQPWWAVSVAPTYPLVSFLAKGWALLQTSSGSQPLEPSLPQAGCMVPSSHAVSNQGWTLP